MVFYYTSTKKENVNIYTLKGQLIDREQPTALLAEIDSEISNNSTNVLLNLAELKIY
jgi:hypothetical protein